MDAEKKELVGAFHNKGRRWGKKQKLVNTYDFPSLAEGRAYPYGLYNEVANEGFVNVGVRSRHGGVCRGEHRWLVADAGVPSLPEC